MMITIFKHARLLDCIGEAPLEDASVVVEDQLIRDIYQGERQALAEATVVDCQGKTLMPGLIDAHTHYAVTTNDMGAVLFEHPFFTALGIKAQLEKTLQAGFTTVRDGGGGHWLHRQAVEDGRILGPRLKICGPLMSITGGHGDFNLRGSMTFPPESGFVKLMRLCDGPDECRKAIREQFQGWADHIKVAVTGGCASPNDEPWQVHLTEAELGAMVDETNSHGTYIMAHSLNDQGNRRATLCGVGTIEHGCFLSEETAGLMKERGTALVSTLAVVWWAEEFGKAKGAAEWFLRKLAHPGCSPDDASIMEGVIRAARVALDAGVPVGSGSDYFGSMCGGEAMNIKLLVDLVGMKPYQALKAATSVNASILRMQEQIGIVQPGKCADLILVEGNPDEDINLINQPSLIRLVMKEGMTLKNTLN